MFRVVEDVVVLGFLAALAIWLFVGLPLLYLPDNAPQHREAAMATTDWLVPVVSFLGGSLAAHIVKTSFDHFTRPVLSVRLVDRKGCYVTTLRGNPPTHDARFLRLLIENAGRSTIKSCNGYVTGITRIVNGNVLPVQQEVLQLDWSSAGGATSRDIPPGAFFYMDVASLDLPSGVSQLALAVAWTPNHLVTLFGSSATFQLDIKVAAENARPVDRTVCFSFDPQQRDLQFQFD